MATLAGAKARALRGRGLGEEAHVLAPRRARRARGTAIHAGRADGVEELPVSDGATLLDGAPASVIGVRVVVGRFMVDTSAAALRLVRRFGERRLARTPAVAVEFKLLRGLTYAFQIAGKRGIL